jgi:hypothetical protein
MNPLSFLIILSGGWLLVNGVLHDIFVLSGEHGKTYNRELLRLLMDGHILITCGVVILFCYKGIQQGQPWAYGIAMAACVSILIYCAMIFPFLKSIFTILIHSALLIALLVNFFKQ